MALDALDTGNPTLALKLSEGLLIADSKDTYAFYIRARANQMLGRHRDGRRAASRAFRFAKTREDRFATAQLAARLAYDENRLTLSQLWLRRSANSAPTQQHENQLARDYRRLRAENPWNTQFRFSAAPSTNVNAGADSTEFIIDGQPEVAVISADGLALSGTVAITDLSTSYRLRADENSAVSLLARLYSRQVFLSSASRQSLLSPTGLPTLGNQDFSATTAQVSLDYFFRLGTSQNTMTLRGDIGRNWYGGAPISNFARLTLGRTQQISKVTSLTFSASYEYRNPIAAFRAPSKIFNLRANYGHRFGNDTTLRLGLDLKKTQSLRINTASTGATAYLSLDLGKAIGPARVSLSIGTSFLDFPTYNSGVVVAADGRHDTTIFTSATFTFETLDYAGFIPTVTLRAQQSRSNVSRFDTTELSVVVGIRSRF